ncbi:uncharacterized protein LOC128741191 [Sabethes cyaneus]|uniref:uncharacterized protein LOC128741191 n=1 Tax=Sabethes cyaneus TaxID=53552 RepID=UPI00237E60E5|nr:uncharacterized protein LOC128741191 [Sabethes cyaneus]
MPLNFNKNDRKSDDDEEFFKPTASSSLAKIFGVASSRPLKKVTPANSPKSSQLSDRYESAFRYIPPSSTEQEEADGHKQISNKPMANWVLIQASVVTAYKLVGTENVSQAKLGLALLKSEDNYKILLYRTKTDALATVNVSPSTKMFLNHNYLQFHSDDECFWSVLFDQLAEKKTFCSTIGKVCKVEERKDDVAVCRPIPASRTTIPIVEEPDSDSTDRKKTNLLTRIAKVGQPILVQDKQFRTEISDSSDTDVRIETIPRHRRTGSGSKIHPVTIGMQMLPSSTALSTAIAGQNLMQTSNDCNFNMLMAENRMQGTELRMNLSKIESKLERVLDKIDLLSPSEASGLGIAKKSTFDRDEVILNLEETILEHKKENHMLKRKIRNLEMEATSSTQLMKTEELLMQADKRCQSLQDEVAQLRQDVQTSKENSCKDIKEIERLSAELVQKTMLAEKNSKNIQLLEEQLTAAQKEQASLQQTNLALENDLKNCKSTITTLQQTQLAQSEQQEKQQDHVIKNIMNTCFHRICEEINDPRVLQIVGEVIKKQTKAALQSRLAK